MHQFGGYDLYYDVLNNGRNKPIFEILYEQEYSSENNNQPDHQIQNDNILEVKIRQISHEIIHKLSSVTDNSILAIIWDPICKFENLIRINLNFDWFTHYIFEWVLDYIQNLNKKISVIFNYPFNNRNYSVDFENGLLFYKSNSNWYIIKTRKASIVFGKRTRVYHANHNLLIFDKWVWMNLIDLKLLDHADKSYKMFNYYLSEINDNKFDKRKKYFAIINRNYNAIRFNSLFKRFLPNPSGAKEVEVLFTKEWNIPQTQCFKEFLSKISSHTLVSLIIRRFNTTIQNLEENLGNLSVWSIKFPRKFENQNYVLYLQTIQKFIQRFLFKPSFRTLHYSPFIYFNYITNERKKLINEALEGFMYKRIDHLQRDITDLIQITNQ